jgi:uncharacterized membrane protein YdbT with pleckstrin-like domain
MPFTLDKDEEVIVIAQKHPFILLLELIPLTLAYVILMAGILGYLPYYTSSYFSHAGQITVFMAGFFTFIFWLFGWILWLDYHLDAWVITSKRIIDLDQHGVFNRETAELWLNRVQDVTIKVDGILASLLKYGAVRVQTAGETQEFVMYGIKNPYEIQQIIFRALADRKNAQSHEQSGV